VIIGIREQFRRIVLRVVGEAIVDPASRICPRYLPAFGVPAATAVVKFVDRLVELLARDLRGGG
jgi:hypothetical protein